MDISGKTVLLTGASSGIGYQLARLLAEEKCNLAIMARRTEILEELAEELKKTGIDIIAVRCDVTDREDVKQSVKKVKAKFGNIDVAILNSGVSGREKIENFNSDLTEKVFKVNVFGISYFVEELVPDFLERKTGMIVGVSSLADGRGFPQSGLYCASKAAATKLLESFRIELKKYGVKVLTVKPGFVKTPMTDKNRFKMPFLMSAEKAAGIILNGIKKEKRTIQFPLPTVWGAKFLRILPDGIFDKIAERVKS